MVAPVTREAHKQPSAILKRHELAMMGEAGARAPMALKCVLGCMQANGHGLRRVQCAQDGWQHCCSSSGTGRYYRPAAEQQNVPTSSSAGASPGGRRSVLQRDQSRAGTTAGRTQSGDGCRSRPPDDPAMA